MLVGQLGFIYDKVGGGCSWRHNGSGRHGRADFIIAARMRVLVEVGNALTRSGSSGRIVGGW